MKSVRRPERLLLAVQKGALVPADGFTARRLRERGFKVGDHVLAVLTKPRNSGYHRLAHAFGQMLVDNVDAFAGMDAHATLKRLQIEANVGCDEIALNFPNIGPCTYRVPRSLSFESMDQSEFEQTFRAFADYVSRTYWRGLAPEQIEAMAQVMPEAA